MSLIFQKFLIITIILSLLVFSFFYIDINYSEIFLIKNWNNIFSLFKEFANPDLNKNFNKLLLFSLLETFCMSIASIFFSFIFAIFITIFSNTKNKFILIPINLVLNFLRSIPEIMWALLLLITFGIGPLSGTIALFLHTSGILGKLFIEVLKNSSNNNGRSLRIAGNSETKILFFVTFPLIFSQLLNYTFYRWENNIRAASVLGIVGAGGLGQLLYYHLSLFHYQKVSTIIIMLLILIIIVDQISAYFRKKLTR